MLAVRLRPVRRQHRHILRDGRGAQQHVPAAAPDLQSRIDTHPAVIRRIRIEITLEEMTQRINRRIPDDLLRRKGEIPPVDQAASANSGCGVEAFVLRSGSVSTLTGVTSDPVPQVVGTRMSDTRDASRLPYR